MNMLLTILLCILLFKYHQCDAISCLVIRPGYGLVPETCSQTAVGCRIRVSGDHIEWYEWAKLYDRNQLVCVYPGEYDTVTGCQRKPSGSVRCWCGAKDNCNEAETSKSLYEAFTTNDKKQMASIVKDLESNATPTEETTTTTRKAVKPTSSSKLIRVTMRTKVHHRPPTTTATEPQTTTRAKFHELPRKPTHVTVEEDYEDEDEEDDDDATEEDDDRILNNEEPRPLPTESAFGFDDTFEETRKKLEKEMKEEDERLKELLRDEEQELEDEDEVPARQAKSFSLNAKKSRLSAAERRDRGRGSEERRNQAEEERLAEIEREEMAEKMKKMIEHSRQREQERQEDDDEDDSDEDEDIAEEMKKEEEEAEAGFGFSKTATSSSWASWCSVMISLIVARQVLSSNVI